MGVTQAEKGSSVRVAPPVGIVRRETSPPPVDEPSLAFVEHGRASSEPDYDHERTEVGDPVERDHREGLAEFDAGEAGEDECADGFPRTRRQCEVREEADLGRGKQVSEGSGLRDSDDVAPALHAKGETGPEKYLREDKPAEVHVANGVRDLVPLRIVEQQPQQSESDDKADQGLNGAFHLVAFPP